MSSVRRWGSGRPLPLGIKRQVKTRRLSGVSWGEVMAEFGICRQTLAVIMGNDAVMPLVPVRGLDRLSAQDRETISIGVATGVSDAELARRVGCHRSTIGREVARNGGRGVYRAVNAERATCERAKRSKPTKLEHHPVLAGVVRDWLVLNWSPAQISGRLLDEFPDDETMRVSAETIYQSIYVYSRGALKTELAKHLRTQRPLRRPRSVTARNEGPIRDKVMIADRPEEIETRLVPGHWEGDLIIGANQASQIGTLVERTTGVALLIQLPDGREADVVAAALERQTRTLPPGTCRSVTWDQGSEMAAHKSFTIATDIDVYFCNPHAPWERGSNENFNGLLRQYFPKGTDLSHYSQADLDAVAKEINDRPRKRHNFKTPSEMFSKQMLH